MREDLRRGLPVERLSVSVVQFGFDLADLVVGDR